MLNCCSWRWTGFLTEKDFAVFRLTCRYWRHAQKQCTCIYGISINIPLSVSLTNYYTTSQIFEYKIIILVLIYDTDTKYRDKTKCHKDIINLHFIFVFINQRPFLLFVFCIYAIWNSCTKDRHWYCHQKYLVTIAIWNLIQTVCRYCNFRNWNSHFS